jgi:5-methylcytosine-specific restriction endonuclease McrA
MPWTKTPEDRRRDYQVYNDPVYKRNRALVRRRSGGRCESADTGRRCASRDRVQCDHIIPVSHGGSHDLANLRDLCKPCHDRKTATEGGGFRNTATDGGGNMQRPRPPLDPEPTPRTRW